MKKGHFSDEQIVAVLRDAEATTAVAAARKHGVLGAVDLPLAQQVCRDGSFRCAGGSQLGLSFIRRLSAAQRLAGKQQTRISTLAA